MKIRNLLTVITISIVLLNPMIAKSDQFSELESEYYGHLADFFHQSREVPGHLELALKNYLKAQKPSLLWKISRCYWLMGEASVSSDNKIIYFEKGVIYAQKALEEDAQNSKSYLWHALTLGSLALEKGVMKMIYQKDVIKSALEKTISLDPKNMDAYLGLASWYFHVPELLGGSKLKSFQIVNQALTIDHNYTMAYMIKADFLIKTQQQKQAKKILKILLKIKNPSSISGGIQDKANAANLLSKL
ncbi:MAG: hypothetical protein HOD92_17720 [Deltaproteobacteria bacterium]|nr:hypothetical protein [Deltaproteobacteria bacterium]MBT4528125.1 hypothetical protein [Deltaproteobacteria bacterium]